MILAVQCVPDAIKWLHYRTNNININREKLLSIFVINMIKICSVVIA